MIKRSAAEVGPQDNKGWLAGPWDSVLPCAVGFADAGVDDIHHHSVMYEIYLVARGTSAAVVDGVTIALAAGDMLCVEPGEAHTFIQSSADYFHFVVQSPFEHGDKVTRTDQSI